MFAPIFACVLGCGVQITTVVQAKASPEARREGRYEIVAGDPHVTPTNPDLLAIAKVIGRALQAEGFVAAKSHDDSTLVVIVDWMTGDPVEHRRHLGGDTGDPQVRGAAAGMAGRPVGGTTNAGSFGFGADPTDNLTYSYRQTLTLKAVDKAAFKADPAAKGLWEMDLVSDNGFAEPSASAPQMMAAAMPYIAQTAKARVMLGAAETSVRYVRGEIAELPPAAKKD